MSSEVAVEMQGGRWKRYPAYRDSGVEWIGEVPEEWGITRLKYCSRINMGQSPSSEDCNIDGIGLPFLQGTAEFNAINPMPKQYCEVAHKVSHKDDLLISVRAPVGALNIADQDYGIGRGLCGITTNDHNFNSTFCWYLLHHIRVELNMNATGSTYDAVSADDVGNMVIVFPSLPEQRSIAAFLDRETGSIDTLIEKKERQIELLQEKRAALINHAVTKGLDPDVKMKDSGVEWLVEVPEHWEMLALKRLASLKSGESITAENIDKDGDYPVFGGNGLRGYTATFTHDGTYALIGRQGALCGNINYAQGQFWASEHAVVVSPIKPVETKWLGELLRTMNLNQYSVSAAQPGLSVEMVSNLIIPQPPLHEQSTIAAFLDRETECIDTLTTKVRKSISTLREYRTALISAAVTGKIDVRGEETLFVL